MSLPMIETRGKVEDGFRFIKRELFLMRGDETVWVWEDTYTGLDGGKCGTKREAWTRARASRRAVAEEQGISVRALKKRAKEK